MKAGEEYTSFELYRGYVNYMKTLAVRYAIKKNKKFKSALQLYPPYYVDFDDWRKKYKLNDKKYIHMKDTQFGKY